MLIFSILNHPCSFMLYYYLLYRHKCFARKYTTCKIHKKLHRGPLSGLFSIISHVSLSVISLISSLSLKLYLNLLVYHRNIFGSSSKVFSNLRKFLENVRERSSGLRNNFGKSSEVFRRWSEIFRKSSKTPSSTCLYNKKNITQRLEDMNFIFSWQKNILLVALVRKILFCNLKIKYVSSCHRVISSISLVFLYLQKLLFSGFLQFQGNFVHG